MVRAGQGAERCADAAHATEQSYVECDGWDAQTDVKCVAMRMLCIACSRGTCRKCFEVVGGLIEAGDATGTTRPSPPN